MYVCQSISWLTYLMKYRDISCPGWAIFLKFFWDIPEMFVHYFQIVTNFLYVCQSISWLTSLLKLGQYRDNSCSGWDIFLKFYGDIPGIFLHFFEILSIFLSVCQSFSWPLSHWNEANMGISPVLDEISFWIFLETFLGCSYTNSK